MLAHLRCCATAAVTLCGAVIVISATTTAAEARRTCTYRELGRISDTFILDCTKKPGWRISCQSNGDPVCCYNTPWGAKCTTNPGASSFDPGSGPTRPPRAGPPDRGPDRVDPPRQPPRAGGPGPGRVGPMSNPQPSGPTIKSGNGKR